MTTTNHNTFDPTDRTQLDLQSAPGLKLEHEQVHAHIDIWAINYRDLLRKYIAHVQYCEGSDCVTWRKPSAADEVQFTPQEPEELKRLSEEKI